MRLAQATALALILLVAASNAPAADTTLAQKAHVALTASAKQLGALASSVERGAIKGAKALGDAFGKVTRTVQQGSAKAQHT